MWWGMQDGFLGWMLFGMLGMALFWGVVIGFIVWGVRALTAQNDKLPNRETPLKAAAHRYARGEITWEEFEEIKGALPT